ncbi:MAG: type III pantothenate kinase [Muribaculaceae bacterium]
MLRKLTIDEGNSSTKIGLWHDDELVCEQTFHIDTPEQIVEQLSHAPVADAAIFCSVCGRRRDDVERALAPIAKRLIVLDHTTPLPISVEYRTPHTLGCDRVAAAAGAAVISPKRTVLVVDMGTAITYDVVSACGRFIGGNIAPGIFVRLEALQHFTKALPLVETDGDCPRWGYDTETALRSGAIRGVVGELQYYRHCLTPDGVPAEVILTGGSADLIIPYISSPITIEPNLVLIGLNSILNYNER